MGVDITPLTSIIWSIRNAPMDYPKAFGELIDNSLDAGANNVDIGFSSNSFFVRDDGAGVKDLSRILVRGSHVGEGETLGQFGVGLKDAVIWLGNKTEIYSLSGGKCQKISADWGAIEKSQSWVIRNPMSLPAKSALEVGLGGNSGTAIQISKTSKKGPHASFICSKLSYIFAPALRSGKSIRYHKSGQVYEVKAFQFPEMDEKYEVFGDVGGKRLRVTCGIVNEDCPNINPGFSIAFKHRIILNTIRGCGDYSTSRFFAFVELSDDWRDSLGTNKSSIKSGSGLYDELFKMCEEVLAKSHEAGIKIQSDSIISDVQGIINNTLFHRESRRSPCSDGIDEPPTPKEKSKRRKASKVTENDGSVFRKSGGIKAEFVNGDGETIGKVFQGDKMDVVHLDMNHPFIKAAMRDGSTHLIPLTVFNLVSGYAGYIPPSQRKNWLKGLGEEVNLDAFLKASSRFLKDYALDSLAREKTGAA